MTTAIVAAQTRRLSAKLLCPVWHRPGIGVFLVFVFACWQRWSMPGLPLADPDTWGYLNPALQHLAGHGMPQTSCRSMAYPLCLRAVLGIFGSFHAIAFAQHLLGLLSGAVWLFAFNIWLRFLPGSGRIRFFAYWCATFCLALYLCNPATLAFESQIRPESVFPFFGLSQIAATLLFIRARWTRPNGSLAILSGGIAALLAAVCLSLKPSWGLASAVPSVVLLASLCSCAGTPRLTVRFGPVLAAVAALAFWNAGVPRLVGWVADSTCGSHLAGTLFTVHADIIAHEMHKRSARGQLDPHEKDFLAKLDARIAESRQLEKSAYRVLGHDPDYLFFLSDTLWNLPDIPANDFAGRSAYLRRAYLQSVMNEPLLMLRKIARQMAAAFGDASKSVFNPSVQWRPLFPRTLECLQNAELPALSDGMQKGFRQTLDEVRVVSESQPESLRAPWAPSRWFLRHVVTWIFIAIVLAVGFSLLLTSWMLRTGRWRSLTAAIWGAGVVWTSSVGSAVTVSVIHSFDIDRYVMLQSSVNSLLMAVGLVLFAAIARTIAGTSGGSFTRP